MPVAEPAGSNDSIDGALTKQQFETSFIAWKSGFVFLEFQGSVSLAKTCSNTPDMGQLTATSPKFAALWNLYQI